MVGKSLEGVDPVPSGAWERRCDPRSHKMTSTEIVSHAFSIFLSLMLLLASRNKKKKPFKNVYFRLNCVSSSVVLVAFLNSARKQLHHWYFEAFMKANKRRELQRYERSNPS